MAHPVYRNKKGERLPSVTTVISKFKESGGLIHWAWDLGMQGIDYRKVRDDAANAGSLVHSLVEAEIRGKSVILPSDIDEETKQKVSNAYNAYSEWRDQTKLKPEHTEVSLTCDCHQTGGTLDTILVQGKRSLGDWKTSNSIYMDYLIQLAAYKHLWEVNHPDQPIEGGFHLLRFSKESADFTHHYWSELDQAWQAFEHMRALYDLVNNLKKRI